MRIYITDHEQRIEIHHVNPNLAYVSAAVNSDHLYLYFLSEKQWPLPKLLQESPLNAKKKKKKISECLKLLIVPNPSYTVFPIYAYL